MTGGILTTCAVCGAPAATKACGRCKTPYCSPFCPAEHWIRGLKKVCKKIQRAGGAEQFHADAKFKEFADAAVVACAAEGVPQDAECYICMSSIQGKGIVRACACRGSMGLAHLSCLVRQAEAASSQFHEEGYGPGHRTWSDCKTCGQHYYGELALALGWACWRRYLSVQQPRGIKITLLDPWLCYDLQEDDASSPTRQKLAEAVLVDIPWRRGTPPRPGTYGRDRVDARRCPMRPTFGKPSP